jgi:DNA-binding HxlR family transcriptional regulator
MAKRKSPRRQPEKPGKTKKKAKSRARKRQSGARGSGASQTAAKAAGRGAKRSAATDVLAGLKRADGCGVMLVVAEQAGAERDVATAACEVRGFAQQAKQLAKKAARKPKAGAKKTAASKRNEAGGGGRISPRTCRVLAAVGHEQRARILRKLLEGPATYRSLQKLTKLKAGPLYHHVNQLRLSGLIMPKQRDLYELTRGGRNLILAVMAIGPLTRDVRRRPQPSA